jgi:hypothetical protein
MGVVLFVWFSMVVTCFSPWLFSPTFFLGVTTSRPDVTGMMIYWGSHPQVALIQISEVL